jgi:tRNA U34 5-carboxymethylaminomethyl modifying enzyme MnmG/GidA
MLMGFEIASYAPHLPRQLAELALFHTDESLQLDPDMDYSKVQGLSEEVRERLQRIRPTTLVSSFDDVVQYLIDRAFREPPNAWKA